jgi:putative transposase
VIDSHGLHLQWGKAFRILNVIDEYTRECLDVRIKQPFTHKDVLEMLTGLFIDRSVVIALEHNNKT